MADASNETEWAADRKVGFAMGILLIGVVAALFFRNEPLSVTDVPTVEREELIDSRLRDRDVAVYTDEPQTVDDNGRQPWAHPEILSEFGRRDADVAVPIGAGTSPPTAPSSSVTPGPPQVTSDRTNRFRPPPEVTPPMRKPEREPETEADDFSLPDFGRDSPLAETTPDGPDPDSYQEYTVRYGDTLSGIADRMLGSSGRYHEIYEANRDRMDSPDRLTVGATILIPLH